MKWRKIRSALPEDPQAPLYVRLLWMVVIWAGSVMALLAVAALLRLVLNR